jgi:hypothetical protein
VLVGRIGVGRDELAQALDRYVLVEEAAREVAQHRLVLTETEIAGGSRLHRRAHFDFGRPSTRSPRMLRWISLVPAAIV